MIYILIFISIGILYPRNLVGILYKEILEKLG